MAYAAKKFILDQIGAVSSSAYSLRRLSSKYKGPIINIRRSSDNVQRDIYFTPNGDFDAASALSFVGAGTGFVTTWYDQSGKGLNGVQATAIVQPTIIVSGVLQTQAGIPSVRFSNTTSTINIAVAKFAAPSTNWSFNQVGSADNTVGNNSNVFGCDQLNAFNSGGLYRQVSSVFFNRAGANTAVAAASTPASGAPHVFSLTYSAANSATAYLNGVPGTTVNSINYTAGNLTTFDVGIFVSNNSVNLAGYVAEHLSFSSVLSTSDRKAIDLFQGNYYGIQVSA